MSWSISKWGYRTIVKQCCSTTLPDPFENKLIAILRPSRINTLFQVYQGGPGVGWDNRTLFIAVSVLLGTVKSTATSFYIPSDDPRLLYTVQPQPSDYTWVIGSSLSQASAWLQPKSGINNIGIASVLMKWEVAVYNSMWQDCLDIHISTFFGSILINI